MQLNIARPEDSLKINKSTHKAKAVGALQISTSVKAPLIKIADKINKMAIQMGEAANTLNYGRVQMGKMFYEIKERVRLETNMTFNQWCLNYIKKPDGKPFSKITIDNYIMFYKNPARLAADKKHKHTYHQKEKEGINIIKKLNTHEGQLNALMTAWDYSSKETRRQFMSIVGLKAV